MRYNFKKIDLSDLFEPLSRATASVVRLDERIANSSIEQGWIDRSHYLDACASLWIDGELVHIEDLVLHDAGMGIRAPTHELTVAHDVLRTRRRIASSLPNWAVEIAGLDALKGVGEIDRSGPETKSYSYDPLSYPDADGSDDPMTEIEAVLARSETLLTDALTVGRMNGVERDPIVYDEDWDEGQRFSEWRVVVEETQGMPSLLRAALLWDAWQQLQVLKHAPWLGRLLAGAFLRQSGLTDGQLSAVNLGLKHVSRERRTSRSQTVRLLAFMEAIGLASELGLKEHQRLLLAKQQLERRLVGRRQTSRLPQLIELVLSRPLVSSGMIGEALGMTPQGAIKIAAELNLREFTGRGRFRAWGVL